MTVEDMRELDDLYQVKLEMGIFHRPDTERTVYLGDAIVPNGYNGDTVLVHYCYEPSRGITWEVWSGGYYRARYRYVRSPAHDKRISRGDDYAADGWLDTETGKRRETVVNYDPNTRTWIKPS